MKASLLGQLTILRQRLPWFLTINLSVALTLCALSTTIGDVFEISRPVSNGRVLGLYWPFNFISYTLASLSSSVLWLLWEASRSYIQTVVKERFGHSVLRVICSALAWLGLLVVGIALVRVHAECQSFFGLFASMSELALRASWADIIAIAIFQWILPVIVWLAVVGAALFPEKRDRLLKQFAARKQLFLFLVGMLVSWVGTTVRVPVSAEFIIADWDEVVVDPVSISAADADVEFENERGQLDLSLYSTDVHEIKAHDQSRNWSGINTFAVNTNGVIIDSLKKQSMIVAYSVVSPLRSNKKPNIILQ